MKYRIIPLLVCIIFLFSCSQKLSTEKAAEVLKNSLKLSENQKIEIIGTADESKGIVLVKFKINDTALNSKIRKYDQGWQLEEIQNELGVWLPATAISNLFDESKNIRTAMIEISTLATILTDYLTDHAVLPSIAGDYDEGDAFYRAIVPVVARQIPIKDPWGNKYLIYTGKSVEGVCGITGAQLDDFLVMSVGKDGIKETWVYDPEQPEAGLHSETDANYDIVNFNAAFIRGLRSRR